MSNFVKKASSKVEKMSDEQIRSIISAQEVELELRNDVLNTVDAGYAVISKNLQIMYSNRYLADLLQFDFEALIPSKTLLTEVLLDSDVINGIHHSIAGNKDSYEDSFTYNHSILGELKIHVRLLKCKNQYVLVLRDITLLDKFRREFQQNESLASMTTMAAGIAHEIKNPLASMSIYLQLLRKTLDRKGKVTKKEAEKSLDIINEEIDRLNKMAVDFLFAVKPMNVDLHLRELNSLVDKTVALIRAEVEAARVELKVELGTSIPRVSIDENLMKQSILNLIRNSLQAIEGRNGLIEVKTYVDGNSVCLSVKDNGCGMDDTQLTRIFEPYYTTKANGTGLGLTNIFKIVKGHNGEIGVSSHVGDGSTFTIKLPVPQSERFRIE